ncbi:hypothetical protein [Cytobacillus sp. FSL M8-0252]|uniref:hypothetical protein n=1 Tax=Cytobacillus TaxID=2675230 RepID=UPI0030FAF27A
MKNLVNFRLLAYLVVFMLIGGLFPHLSNAEEFDNEEELKQYEIDIEKMISEVEPYVTVTNQGRFLLNPFTPKALRDKYDLDNLEVRLNELNQEAEQGIITILSDKTIIQNVEVQGVTKTVKHWWGYTRYLNNKDTINAIDQLREFDKDVKSSSTILKILKIPVLGFVASVVSNYGKLVASRLEKNNKGNGTILSITWAMVFNVKAQ